MTTPASSKHTRRPRPRKPAHLHGPQDYSCCKPIPHPAPRSWPWDPGPPVCKKCRLFKLQTHEARPFNFNFFLGCTSTVGPALHGSVGVEALADEHEADELAAVSAPGTSPFRRDLIASGNCGNSKESSFFTQASKRSRRCFLLLIRGEVLHTRRRSPFSSLLRARGHCPELGCFRSRDRGKNSMTCVSRTPRQQHARWRLV